MSTSFLNFIPHPRSATCACEAWSPLVSGPTSMVRHSLNPPVPSNSRPSTRPQFRVYACGAYNVLRTYFNLLPTCNGVTDRHQPLLPVLPPAVPHVRVRGVQHPAQARRPHPVAVPSHGGSLHRGHPGGPREGHTQAAGARCRFQPSSWHFAPAVAKVVFLLIGG